MIEVLIVLRSSYYVLGYHLQYSENYTVDSWRRSKTWRWVTHYVYGWLVLDLKNLYDT